MPFNIEQFKQTVGSGFARQAHFEVIMPLPTILNAASGQAQSLSFLCNAAQLGGRSLDVKSVSKGGLNYYQPFTTGVAYDDFSLEFFCDSKGETLKLMHRWLDKIFSFETANYQQLEYRDNYSTTMILLQYDAVGKVICEWEIYDAFPKQLPSLQFDWNARDMYLTVPAVFAYSRYTQKRGNEGVTTITGNPFPAQRNRLPVQSTLPI